VVPTKFAAEQKNPRNRPRNCRTDLSISEKRDRPWKTWIAAPAVERASARNDLGTGAAQDLQRGHRVYKCSRKIGAATTNSPSAMRKCQSHQPASLKFTQENSAVEEQASGRTAVVRAMDQDARTVHTVVFQLYRTLRGSRQMLKPRATYLTAWTLRSRACAQPKNAIFRPPPPAASMIHGNSNTSELARLKCWRSRDRK